MNIARVRACHRRSRDDAQVRLFSSVNCERSPARWRLSSSACTLSSLIRKSIQRFRIYELRWLSAGWPAPLRLPGRTSGTLPHSPECRLPPRRLAQTAVLCMHLQRISTCRGALERPDMPRAHACHGRLTRHPRGECHVGHADPCRLAEVPGLPDGNNCICIRGYGHLERCGSGT